MELFYSTELSIPVIQIVLLLILSTLALLFGRTKLALLINYVFTMYWGYFLSVDKFADSGFQGVNTFSMIYFGIGFVIMIFALIGFLYHE